jgi:RNA polymerase sigma factor for flagellar operon FliA
VTDDDFLAALPLIDDVAAQVCRRHHLDPADGEDFRAEARMHFIADDYAVLRRWERRASLATFVRVVILHLFHDYRNRLWGRWRPSTAACRLGPTGVLLERLIVRDGWPIDQAIEALRVNHGVAIDAELQAFGDKLSARGPSRKFVPEEAAGEIASDLPSPETNVVRAEEGFRAKRAQAVLMRAREALPPVERLILRMRYDDRMPVADIARALHLDQRRLYRTIERILGSLRAAMAADGISEADVERAS